MIDWERLYVHLLYTKRVNVKVKGIDEHHIIPKHDGGTNAADNLILLPRRWHVVAHYIRWRWLNQMWDKLAFNMMLGKINHITHHPDYAEICINRMCSPAAKEKMKNSLIERGKDPLVKKQYSKMIRNYIDSLEDKSLLYKHLHTKSVKKKAKIANLKWKRDNIDFCRTQAQKMNLINIKRNKCMTDMERKIFFGRGNFHQNPNWKGAYKLINSIGINFIFYTKKEMMEITKIANRTIDKWVNTGNAIKLGKYAGFKIFLDKDFVL